MWVLDFPLKRLNKNIKRKKKRAHNIIKKKKKKSDIPEVAFSHTDVSVLLIHRTKMVWIMNLFSQQKHQKKRRWVLDKI